MKSKNVVYIEVTRYLLLNIIKLLNSRFKYIVNVKNSRTEYLELLIQSMIDCLYIFLSSLHWISCNFCIHFQTSSKSYQYTHDNIVTVVMKFQYASYNARIIYRWKNVYNCTNTFVIHCMPTQCRGKNLRNLCLSCVTSEIHVRYLDVCDWRFL